MSTLGSILSLPYGEPDAVSQLIFFFKKFQKWLLNAPADDITAAAA